jgi:hypothetical protein
MSLLPCEVKLSKFSVRVTYLTCFSYEPNSKLSSYIDISMYFFVSLKIYNLIRGWSFKLRHDIFHVVPIGFSIASSLTTLQTLVL